MHIPSSPIAYSPSPPPAATKRTRGDEPPKSPTRRKNRVRGGFLADDDSDDDVSTQERSPKRRMLDSSSQAAQPASVSQTIIDLDKDDEVLADITPPDSQRDDAPPVTSRLGSLLGTSLPDFSSSWAGNSLRSTYKISTCSGKSTPIRERKHTEAVSYESMVAARSRTKEGRAKKSYYGIEIHNLIDNATKEMAESRKETAAAPITPPANPDVAVDSVEDRQTNLKKKTKHTKLWTEKYRARNFMDLVGDDLTNRQVLRWLKRWDRLVFPNAPKKAPIFRKQQKQQDEEEKPLRKVLLLTGPPGLGKTTLAHVCARQAGYDVMEINASDDRSKNVVKGRIRTTLGTETVKTIANGKAKTGKPMVARPVCVIVDEVDGVVTGAGPSGEGGFIKALIDLILVDQKNSEAGGGKKKKKGDDFKQMRPLILICNDVYHPSLRPLRQSGLAEIIHTGKPSVDAVVVRLKNIFEKEGIPCEKDAARKLCEAAWGMTSGIDAKRGAESNAEGDLRGVMVVGEWVAGRLKASSKDATPLLTRQWIDKNIMHELSHGGGGARGIGRGNVREIVSRVFQEGAGFPKQAMVIDQPKNTRHEQPQAQFGFSETHKKYAMARLKEMIDTSGDIDRIMTEVLSEYPNREFNDDSFLSKPNAAYEWMHFHDTCASRVFSSQEWELAAYVSQPILACHHLFASSRRYQPQNNFERKWGDTAEEPEEPPVPFSGPRASWEAFEAEKVNRALLQGIQAQLPPSLSRAFRSPEDLATDFLPYLVRLVSPDVKPVVVGGSDKSASFASVRRESEKVMVKRAAMVLDTVGITLQKGKIEADGAAGPGQRTQWVYRMEPDLDALSTFETAGAYVLASQAPTRYAVRQVLDQELQKAVAAREHAARQSRFRLGRNVNACSDAADFAEDDKENQPVKDHAKQAPPVLSEKERLRVVGLEEKNSVKRDFFGRIITETKGNAAKGGKSGRAAVMASKFKPGENRVKVWVKYNEGLNNAVRKPISLEDFMKGL